MGDPAAASPLLIVAAGQPSCEPRTYEGWSGVADLDALIARCIVKKVNIPQCIANCERSDLILQTSTLSRTASTACPWKRVESNQVVQPTGKPASIFTSKASDRGLPLYVAVASAPEINASHRGPRGSQVVSHPGEHGLLQTRTWRMRPYCKSVTNSASQSPFLCDTRSPLLKRFTTCW